MDRILLLALVGLFLGGCQTLQPKSHGELSSGYTYIPIDPFAVQTEEASSCQNSEFLKGRMPVERRQIQGGVPVYKPIMDSLPDNAVRMLVEQFDESGNVTYGAAKVGGKSEAYQVTVDYISADTVNQELWISKTMTWASSKQRVPVSLTEDVSSKNYVDGSEEYRVTRNEPGPGERLDYTKYNVPVYVGVGLRAIANVRVLEAKANISGIGVIGAEAEDKRLSGTLVVQTLGINGKAIAGALPIQSELNRTTAQNAIVSVASIKTLLYADDVQKNPRVVGLYIPFPGGKPLVNAIISEISQKRVVWQRPCDWVDPKTKQNIL